MAEDDQGRMKEKLSMASYGYVGQEHHGKIYPHAILPIKPVIVIFRDGIEQECGIKY